MASEVKNRQTVTPRTQGHAILGYPNLKKEILAELQGHFDIEILCCPEKGLSVLIKDAVAQVRCSASVSLTRFD